MKKILISLVALTFLFGCSTPKQEAAQEVPVKKETEVQKEQDKNTEDKTTTQEDEKLPEKSKPEATSKDSENNTDLEAELNRLINQKNDLIAEKQHIAKTARGKDKGIQMREINQQISIVSQEIGRVKQQMH